MARRGIVSGGLLALVLFGGAAIAQPVEDPIAADLLKDWEAQKARMVALAEAMPAEQYTFKATPPQRTFGEQLHHLAEAHLNMLKGLDPQGAVPVPALGSGYDRATVLKALDEAYDYGSAVLRASAGKLAEPAGPRTRVRAVWAAMGNAMNHYGQCVVYLRLNDIVPPASRR